MIKVEASACTRKYFKALSVVYLFFFFIIKGINDIMFTSSASQAINQEELETTNSTEIIKKKINTRDAGFSKID
jgi:hypothetical protein